jgi:predicted enzyme related to lactoylglutathione lyase
MLVSPTPGRPKLLLQRVPEPSPPRTCMHLDIEVGDVQPEATRLEGLGASRLRAEPQSEHGSTWILMADLEGNEFCVCDGGQGSDDS